MNQSSNEGNEDNTSSVREACGPQQELVRVLRVLEYQGSREWVEDTLSRCAVKGTYKIGNTGNLIRSAVIGDFPHMLRRKYHEQQQQPAGDSSYGTDY